MWQGTVRGLFYGPRPQEPMRAARQVRLVAGVGIVGDRCAAADADPERQVTLIESEALQAARRDHGVTLEPADTRRNIVTAGVGLNHLVGVTFAVGEATLRGVKLCEPCGRMQRLCGKKGALRALVHRGGLNAEILAGGVVWVGDTVAPT